MEFTANITLKQENDIFIASLSFIDDCSKLKILEIDSILHPLEYKRYSSFRNEKRQMSFILGRYTAKMAISSLCNFSPINQIFIDAGVFNQPIVKRPNLPNICVSISHNELSSIALAYPEDYPMGIDLECIDEDRILNIPEFFTPHEHNLSAILYNNKPLFYTILWTAKESLSKVLKTGLTTGFNTLEVSTIEYNLNGFYRITFTNFFQYQTFSIVFNDKVITIILPRKTSIQSLEQIIGEGVSVNNMKNTIKLY
ncbi:MAG: 4'-phosphopantetheinyl transferase superfamily protein [Arcicella sp.]|jgi:phosphopantetheinyl transferase|nr:4'-phosphopantetheinyl transferase superfamily protein [Arcicella sp.]